MAFSRPLAASKPLFHGVESPVNGIQPAIGGIERHRTPYVRIGVESPVNGIQPAIGGIEPPVDGVESPVNGIQPAIGGIEPPVDGVESPVNGIQPAIGGIEPLGKPSLVFVSKSH